MQGNLETIIDEAESFLSTSTSQVLKDFNPKSILSSSQAGAFAHDLLQFITATGGLGSLGSLQSLL